MKLGVTTSFVHLDATYDLMEETEDIVRLYKRIFPLSHGYLSWLKGVGIGEA